MNSSSITTHKPGTFAIVGDARTGTSMLRHLLDAHPDIRCLGEYLSNDVATVIAPRIPQLLLPLAQPVLRSRSFKTIRLLRFLATPAPTARFGFKALYEQLPDPILPRLLNHIERFILIIRLDRVRRALSLTKAQASGRWNVLTVNTESLPTDAPCTVRYEDLTDMIDRAERLDSQWLTRCASLGDRCMMISYEDLIAQRADTLAAIFRFLEVDEAPASTIEPATARMSSVRPLSDQIENFSELLERGSGTRYAEILKEFDRPKV